MKKIALVERPALMVCLTIMVFQPVLRTRLMNCDPFAPWQLAKTVVSRSAKIRAAPVTIPVNPETVGSTVSLWYKYPVGVVANAVGKALS